MTRAQLACLSFLFLVAPARADGPRLRRCTHTRASGSAAERMAAAAQRSWEDDCQPPSLAYCDPAGALAQCCEPGMIWNGSACACDPSHHADQGHCCAEHARWVGPAGALGRAMGRCCPEGTEGLSSPVYSTDIGRVGGGIVACCPPGQRVDQQGCYEPMPCLPIDHSALGAREQWLGCGASPIRRATSGSKSARVLLGPVTHGDGVAAKPVADAVRAALPSLRRCYEQALTSEPSLAGFIELELEIMPAGRPIARRIFSPVGPAQDALIQCAHMTVNQDLHLPASAATRVVSLLLAFQHPEPRKR